MILFGRLCTLSIHCICLHITWTFKYFIYLFKKYLSYFTILYVFLRHNHIKCAPILNCFPVSSKNHLFYHCYTTRSPLFSKMAGSNIQVNEKVSQYAEVFVCVPIKFEEADNIFIKEWWTSSNAYICGIVSYDATLGEELIAVCGRNNKSEKWWYIGTKVNNKRFVCFVEPFLYPMQAEECQSDNQSNLIHGSIMSRFIEYHCQR